MPLKEIPKLSLTDQLDDAAIGMSCASNLLCGGLAFSIGIFLYATGLLTTPSLSFDQSVGIVITCIGVVTVLAALWLFTAELTMRLYRLSAKLKYGGKDLSDV
jgi:hypothetical protein